MQVWPAAIVLTAMTAFAGCSDGARTFDPIAWASERGNADGHSRRAELVTRLPDAGVVVGARRVLVRRKLGEPDGDDAGRDIYVLGRGTFAPDTEALVIDYDERGVITRIGRSQS